MALFGSLRSTHILMPPVFFCITTMGETQGDASIRSITPEETNLFNSSDTSDLTAKGRRRSFWGNRYGRLRDLNFMHETFHTTHFWSLRFGFGELGWRQKAPCQLQYAAKVQLLNPCQRRQRCRQAERRWKGDKLHVSANIKGLSR